MPITKPHLSPAQLISLVLSAITLIAIVLLAIFTDGTHVPTLVAFLLGLQLPTVYSGAKK
jgi:hypothetical protein